MPEHYCSLIANRPQPIPPDAWTVVRFPYGPLESDDEENMHRKVVNGREHPYPSDPASGLIRPAHTGPVGTWSAMYQFESADGAQELRAQFCRDPFGSPNTTATRHHPPSIGMQCEVLVWQFRVRADTPVALRVRHDSAKSLELVFAEFKLHYRTD